MQEQPMEQEIDLLELIQLLLTKWYVIVSVTLAVVAITAMYSFVILDDTYTSTTSMLVLVERDESITAGDFAFGQRLVDTYSQLAQSDEVLTRVMNQTNLGLTERQIRDMMTINGVRDTIVIQLSVESESPETAALLANTIAEVMQDVSTRFQGFDNIEILDVARVPLTPSGPNRLLFMAIGVVLGGMLGVFTVFVIEFLDRTIKKPKDIENKLKLRVIGVVPDYEVELESEFGHHA